MRSLLRAPASRAVAATAPAAVAALRPMVTRRKSEIPTGQFDIDALRKAQWDLASVPDKAHGTLQPYTFDPARERAKSWRIDEGERRAEAEVRAKGRYWLPPLDYPMSAGVPPLLSGQQLCIHYERHHNAYVVKLNELLKAKPDYVKLDLIDLIRATANGVDNAIFNNAAQHWNHAFFWKSISPHGSLSVPPALEAALTNQWPGGMAETNQRLRDACMAHFGSGWVWLCWNANYSGPDGSEKGRFEIFSTKNAETPLTMPGMSPLLTIDCWEHSWYADYECEKAAYVNGIEKVLDWNWAEWQWKNAKGEKYTRMGLI